MSQLLPMVSHNWPDPEPEPRHRCSQFVEITPPYFTLLPIYGGLNMSNDFMSMG